MVVGHYNNGGKWLNNITFCKALLLVMILGDGGGVNVMMGCWI